MGDSVQISKHKQIFEKGYLPNWTEEIFKIPECIPRTPIIYRVKDYQDEVLEGNFYEAKLQKITEVDKPTYIVEKVLQWKNKKGVPYVLVKWHGYQSSMNSWILTSHLIPL